MGESTDASESRTTGKLKYEVVEGRTTATHVYATYPLKFLHPQRTIHQGFDTSITVSQCRLGLYDALSLFDDALNGYLGV